VPGCTYDTKLVKKRKWERFSFFSFPNAEHSKEKNEEEKKCKERRFLVEDVVCAAQANMI